MRKVRQSVFETNSSSTHSISIASFSEGDLMDTIPLDVYGNIVLEGGEFGWEIEDYSDALSKANYVAIYIEQWASPYAKEHFRKKFVDVLREQTSCDEVVLNFSEDYSKENWSFIDHQSVEAQQLDWLFESSETLRQFIFNPKSILHTDNDNY